MKVDIATRFPHPVLSESSGDYQNGEFFYEISEIEESSTGDIIVKYKASITEPSILEMVETGKARLGLFVTCLETYFNDVISLDKLDGYHAFKRGFP